MPQDNSSPHFNTNFSPPCGQLEKLAPGVSRICAPNRGPYTFTGTNSYLLGEKELLVLDPGPNNEKHLEALLKGIAGRPVTAILLSHTHKDHSALARRLHKATGAPLWFGGPHRLSRPRRRFEVNLLYGACDWDLKPQRTLTDGERIEFGDMALDVVATPGHCANHLCFAISGTPVLFTGDHVMGWNSTLVATPDGSMAQYLASLDLLARGPWHTYFPGHGAPLGPNWPQTDGARFAADLRRHRMARGEQVLELIGNGADTVKKIVNAIYPKTSTKIRMAASLTIQAHVEQFEDQGLITVRRGWGGDRLSLRRNGK